MRDTSVLDNIIYGRVDPHIYAFSTNTIPNYLKVGDTHRPVSIRLEEWRVYFSNLTEEFEEIAKVDGNTFFRDYSVHKYLEEHDKKRLEKKDLSKGIYYSREFFKDTSAVDIKNAISPERIQLEKDAWARAAVRKHKKLAGVRTTDAESEE